jgi:nucleoside-diphosphate-sugar epimerase
MTNILGTKNALDLAAECDAETLFISTNDIYGTGAEGQSFKEEDTGKLNLSVARSCYTESKRASEALCQSYISEKSLTVKIIRLPRLFGPTLLPTDSKASSQFLHKALTGEDIILKSDGSQYFTYAYVTDAVKAMLIVLLNGKSGEAYNAGVDACNIRLKDFAKICAEYCGKDVKFELPDEVEKRGYSFCQYVVMDNTKISAIGFTPNYDIKTAIYRTLSIVKERK